MQGSTPATFRSAPADRRVAALAGAAMLSVTLSVVTAPAVSGQELPTAAMPNPVDAATAPPVPMVMPRAAPIGGDLFPVTGLPPESCLATAPPLGSPPPAAAIDASRMKHPREIERLRKKHSGTLHIINADFRGRDFAKVKLSNVCFYNSQLGLTRWTGFSGSGIGFIDTDLTGATLAGARAPWSLLRDVILNEVDATGIDISFSRLDGGWKGSMRNLKLDNAQLVGFRVECGVTERDGCPLSRQGLSLKGANLTKASFYPFYFPDVDATDTILDQTEVGLEHLYRFNKARVVGPLVVRSARHAAVFLPRELLTLKASLASAAGPATVQPSFDCNAARTVVQRVICTAPGTELRQLDRDVADLHAARAPSPTRSRRSRATREASAAATIMPRGGWERDVRDPCAMQPEDEIAGCLIGVYRGRRDALLSMGGQPEWLKPNSYALFLSTDAPLAPAFLRSELFLRIRPVVFDAAQSRLMVAVDGDGRVSAKGYAAGGCRVQATGLEYDAGSGWFTAGGTAATRRRSAVSGVPVLRGSAGRVDIARTETGVMPTATGITCPDGARFVPMQRVDVSSESLAALWGQF